MESVPKRTHQTHFVAGTGATAGPQVNSKPVEFLEIVEDDLRHACAFYESWQTDGALKFQAKFRETIDWIEWNPELFPRKYLHFRRAIIRKSYFGIFYAVEPEVTVVVAVLDLRRDPRTIRRMIRRRARR